MVDCASEGFSKKLFLDVHLRGREKHRIHAQSLGKAVGSIDQDEAAEMMMPFAMRAIVELLLFVAVSKTRLSSSLTSENNMNVPFTRAFISQILTLEDRGVT